MKKCALFLAALSLCAMFAGCDAEDPENLFEVPETTAPQDTVQLSTATEPAASVDSDYYQYGNMQRNAPDGNFILYDGKIWFTWIEDGINLLYTYDVATGEVGLLCKDATCTHDPVDASALNCLANKVYGNLEQYRGELYAKSTDMQLIKWNGARFEKLLDGNVTCFWHGNGTLFVETQDMSLLAYEDESDPPRALLDEYAERWNTTFGRYVYSGGFGKGFCRVDLTAENPQLEVLVPGVMGITDGQYFYYSDEADGDRLYRCDMNGQNTELLVDQPVFMASFNFDDEYLYFRMYNPDDMFGEGSHTLYRMDKADPGRMEQMGEFPESIHSVYTVPGYDLLFVETVVFGTEGENGTYYCYVMDLNSGSITPLDTSISEE